MKYLPPVEHLTLFGSQKIQTHEEILPQTLILLSNNTQDENEFFSIPNSNFKYRIRTDEYFAFFEIYHNLNPFSFNWCCFGETYSEKLFTEFCDVFQPFTNMMKRKNKDIIHPKIGNWLYTAILDIIPPSEIIKCPQYELYIYYYLLQTRLKPNIVDPTCGSGGIIF